MARAEARVEQYWNGDGLHEIDAGVLFGLTAVWACVTGLSGLSREVKSAFSASLRQLLLAGLLGEEHLVAVIRRRLTIPRRLHGLAEVRGGAVRDRCLRRSVERG